MTTITITTKALRAGSWVDGVWQPGGQLLATLTTDASPAMVSDIVSRLLRADPARPGLDAEEAWAVDIETT